MKKVYIGIRCLVVLLTMFPLTAEAVNYYVSPSGNDTNPGTLTKPWKTIQKAANTLVAGDTVYIMAGTYPEQVVAKNSGTPGNYITYTANPGDIVTIDGTTVTLSSLWDAGLIEIESLSYIKVSGLRVINSGPYMNNNGIYVDGSSYIIIENNYTYNTVASGIGIWSSNNIIVDGNEIELACNDGEQECLTIGTTNIFEVRNNYIHNGGPGTNGGEGICIKDGSSNGKVFKNHIHHMGSDRTNIYLDAWDKHTFNIDIFQNIVHDSGAGISCASENGGLLENIRIYNNIAYGNKSNGLEIGNWGEPGILVRPIKNITFVNNTTHNNGTSGWGGGFLVENPDCQNIIVRNNIFSQNDWFQIGNEILLSPANLIVTHNLIYGFRGNETWEIRGANYVEADPWFVNVSLADYHLQGTSPAIDKGTSTDAPTDDYEGNLRPQGAGYDIGAFEYVSGPTVSAVPTYFINFYLIFLSCVLIGFGRKIQWL